ncbi:hypothetical protein HPP92_000255 [Vanilla planifolia]|uniref:Uncharacterized protein n=1 Tax=Vanilla planifolia TaxID=51239 RepID=A0A835VKD4_VANPL|nr:hypothetical protein HPP92_000255 [Vanilla planifolia]
MRRREKEEKKDQNMSRISRMGRLQSGHDRRPIHSSRAHDRQNVWPQGMNAAPLFFPKHTQQHSPIPHSPPPSVISTFSSVSHLISVLLPFSFAFFSAAKTVSISGTGMSQI